MAKSVQKITLSQSRDIPFNNMRDLFAHDDGGWLQDVPLLDRLATS